MPALTQQQWDEVRRAYVETSESVREIAARFGISRWNLHDRSKAEGWPRRRPRPGASAKRSLSAATIDVRRRLIRRLFRILETEIDLMESRMHKRVEDLASGKDDVPAAEREREARAMANFVRSLDKVTEIAADLDRTTDGRGESTDADELFAEADRFRRELAERLSKFIPVSG